MSRKGKMSRKKMEELVLEAPWGKLAMATWGDPAKSPVLLVHGYVDSAATFVPLVNLLPDDYYYVAIDLPGHGRSEPLPGPTLSQLHLVESIRQVVEQLRWDTFICIAHSMGYIISCYYSAAFPGRISKMVALDPPTPVGFHLLAYKPKLWFKHHIESYYDNYLSRGEPRLYSYEEAVSLVVRARDMTEEQSELILSRSLVKKEEGKYSLTWGPKVKKISTVPISFEMFYATLSSNAPTLSVVASETPSVGPTADYAAKMFKKLQSEMKHFLVLNVEGGHSVHFTNPESFVEYVIDFMQRDFSVKSKL